MHSQSIALSVGSIAQTTKREKEKLKEIQLDYDGSISRYVRAQGVGVPKSPVNEFLLRDKNPLGNVSCLRAFLYGEVVRDIPYFQLLSEAIEENGPCCFADLDETIAFLAHRELFGSKRVVCANSGVMTMDCVRPKFVSFRFGFNEESGMLLPRVSPVDARIISAGNIVLFRKGGTE